MLRLYIPESEECWDERNEVFVTFKAQTLTLEHSLISLSKWESKWKKSFLDRIEKEQLTREELLDYFRCMTLTQNVDPDIYYGFSDDIRAQILAYINDSMTATTFSKVDDQRGGSKQIVTSELIYYWMTAHRIPFEAQKWHLNRLLTLIRICNIKNQEPKKMGKNQLRSRNRALNAARRKKLNSTG